MRSSRAVSLRRGGAGRPGGCPRGTARRRDASLPGVSVRSPVWCSAPVRPAGVPDDDEVAEPNGAGSHREKAVVACRRLGGSRSGSRVRLRPRRRRVCDVGCRYLFWVWSSSGLVGLRCPRPGAVRNPMGPVGPYWIDGCTRGPFSLVGTSDHMG